MELVLRKVTIISNLGLVLLHLLLHHIVLHLESPILVRQLIHLYLPLILQLVHLVFQLLHFCAQLGVSALKRKLYLFL